jgi:hypothetical protein
MSTTKTVVNNVTVNRVSYNGGPGGVNARPRPQDEMAARERHIPPVAVQRQHFQAARSNPQLRASANHDKPPVAATARPAEFHSAVPASEAGAPYNPRANRRAAQPRGGENKTSRGGVHPKDLPPFEHPAAANTGNPNRDRNYQQQQQKMFAKQEQERQKLQQKQDREQQRLTQHNASEARKQQVEQRHQQQTEQLQQKTCSAAAAIAGKAAAGPAEVVGRARG